MPGIQDWLTIPRPITKTYHINSLEKDNEMILSTDTERAFGKIQHPLWKILSKLGVEENFLILTQSIYKTPQLTHLTVKNWEHSC